MSQLTTHVLDIVKGTGAAGMRVELRGPDGAARSLTLDDGGRAVLAETVQDGAYELRFHAAAYRGAAEFYDVIPVRILVRDTSMHYHVPLILSAFGYTTYRGG